MNKKKPILERVDPGFGSSVLVKKHTEFLKKHKLGPPSYTEKEIIRLIKAFKKKNNNIDGL